VFALSGGLDIEHAARPREFLANEANGRVTLDLKGVTLVGRNRCSSSRVPRRRGFEIVNCPSTCAAGSPPREFPNSK